MFRDDFNWVMVQILLYLVGMSIHPDPAWWFSFSQVNANSSKKLSLTGYSKARRRNQGKLINSVFAALLNIQNMLNFKSRLMCVDWVCVGGRGREAGIDLCSLRAENFMKAGGSLQHSAYATDCYVKNYLIHYATNCTINYFSLFHESLC